MILAAILGITLYFLVFLVSHQQPEVFWPGFAGVCLIAAAGGLLTDRGLRTQVFTLVKGPHFGQAVLEGLFSASVLYAIFYAGDFLLHLFFPHLAQSVGAVYNFKQGMNVQLIALLIILVIGPGEELFWRGLIQPYLTKRWPHWGVPCHVLLYTGVHLPSGNPSLILAAVVCGLFWGLLYSWRRSLITNTVSHVTWDLLVFLIFPFRT